MLGSWSTHRSGSCFSPTPAAWPGGALIFTHKCGWDNGVEADCWGCGTTSRGAGRFAGSWRHRIGEAEAAKGGSNIVHALEAAPQGLGSRFAVGFAGKKAAELGD